MNSISSYLWFREVEVKFDPDVEALPYLKMKYGFIEYFFKITE